MVAGALGHDEQLAAAGRRLEATAGEISQARAAVNVATLEHAAALDRAREDPAAFAQECAED